MKKRKNSIIVTKSMGYTDESVFINTRKFEVDITENTEGIVIDIYKRFYQEGEEPIKSYTFWNDDVETN